MPCTSNCGARSYEVFPESVNDWLCTPVDPGEFEDDVPANVTVTVTEPVPLVVTCTRATYVKLPVWSGASEDTLSERTPPPDGGC